MIFLSTTDANGVNIFIIKILVKDSFFSRSYQNASSCSRNNKVNKRNLKLRKNFVSTTPMSHSYDYYETSLALATENSFYKFCLAKKELMVT